MHTSRLTSTLRRLIRRDPAARLVDTTAGSSCGVMPTAMASENSSASMIGLCSTTLMTKIDGGQRPGDVDQQHRELAQPDLELGVELVGAQPGGDLAELGARPGRHHHAAAAAGMHDRAHQGAPGQLGQRRPRRRRVGVLVDRQRLAGEHRLVALQAADLEQPDVRGDDVTQPQLDHVAGHQVRDVHRAGCPSRMTTVSWWI